MSWAGGLDPRPSRGAAARARSPFRCRAQRCSPRPSSSAARVRRPDAGGWQETRGDRTPSPSAAPLDSPYALLWSPARARRPRTQERSLAGLRRLRAPQNAPHASGELARREGLRHVVVGPELEPDDPVGLLAAGREHDHRQLASSSGSSGRARARRSRAASRRGRRGRESDCSIASRAVTPSPASSV